MKTRELAIATAPTRTSIQWKNTRTDYHALLEKADRKSTRLNSSHTSKSRMPSSA